MMGGKTIVLLACITGILILNSSASAGVIGSYSYSFANMDMSIETDWRASLSLGNDMSDVEGRTFLFNGLDSDGWTDADTGVDILDNVGKTFWIGSNQDDPDYDLFVSRLTDGVPDNVQAAFADSYGWAFSYWLPIYIVRGWPDVGDYNFDHADLDGYSIDRIGLTINSASYTYVSGATNPHVYSWDITYTFEGEPLPEPTSLVSLLAGVGGCGLLRLHRRRQ